METKKYKSMVENYHWMLLVICQGILMAYTITARSALIDSKGTNTPAVRQKSKEYLPKRQWGGVLTP